MPADSDNMELDYSTIFDSKDSADKSSTDEYADAQGETEGEADDSPFNNYKLPSGPTHQSGRGGIRKEGDAKNRAQDVNTREEDSSYENGPEQISIHDVGSVGDRSDTGNGGEDASTETSDGPSEDQSGIPPRSRYFRVNETANVHFTGARGRPGGIGFGS